MEIQTAKKKTQPVVTLGRKLRGRHYEGQHANVQSILHGGRIQPKLRVGQPNDKYEQEADRVAEQVMRMPVSQSQIFSSVDNPPPGNNHSNSGTIQRTCASCAEDEGLIQTKTTGGFTPGVTPAIGAGIQSLQSGGQPLSHSERGFFEPRIGADFSSVRVHNDTRAANVAKSINARAFTHGHHVVFGAGEYTPNTASGKKLLAHELTHVVQQNDYLRNLIPSVIHVALHGDGRVRRAPYQTIGINLSRTDITNLASTSYWEQRTLRAYSSTLHTRFASNAEERDAVLAALWATNPPTTVTSAQERFVRVPARTLPAVAGATPTQAPALIYLAQFGPPVAGNSKPVLTLTFVSTGAHVAAPAPPAAFQPGLMSANSQGFPGGRSAYFTAHPQEHRALAHWLQNTPAPSIDAVVTTQSGTGAASHHSVFHVTATRTGTTLTGVNIDLVSQTAVGPAQILPADYRQRDGADLELDTLRANATAANRLGTITLPANLPSDERTSVKYTIWQYFVSGSRNTEADAIVPVGSSLRTVLYTLVFGANNAVTVTRIGETGTGAGRVAMNRMDVIRVRGFPTAPTTANLRVWWTSRYPHGGTLTANPPAPTRGTTAPTVATLTAEMNQFISAGIANQNWFNQNYGIEVLDAGPLATRLRTVHNVPGPQGPLAPPNAPPDMTADTINFNHTDLRMLELSLQTLSNAELTRVRGVKMGRKTAAITRTATGYQAGPANQSGLTLMDSSGSTSNTTILFFQGLNANNDRLFVGSSAANALPDVTMTFVHELGHAAGFTAGIEAAFNTWVAAHPQVSPTWYAASNPASELFPEAFALYHTDPRFLCNSSPLLYAWFHALATTGSAPPATPALTALTSCP